MNRYLGITRHGRGAPSRGKAAGSGLNRLKPLYERTTRQTGNLLHAIAVALTPWCPAAKRWPLFADTTDLKDAHVVAGALKLNKEVYAGQPVALVTTAPSIGDDSTKHFLRLLSWDHRYGLYGRGLSLSICSHPVSKPPRLWHP